LETKRNDSPDTRYFPIVPGPRLINARGRGILGWKIGLNQCSRGKPGAGKKSDQIVVERWKK